MYRKILSWLLTLTIIFTMIGGSNINASGLEFVDVEEHWAKAEIENWTEKGIINGYKDGTFKPDDNITRAEFITLINKVINIQGEEEISFEDVDGSEWYYNDLKKAIYGEYIGGYEDNTFRANDNITRQEVAVILQNLVQLKSNEESGLEKFTDTEDIPTWSRAALNLAVQKGYLTGYADNSLKALNYITRAESVKVLTNVFGTIYNESGVYGPGLDEEILEVKGNVTVSVEDVTLQNMTIDGDLYLAEGIGEGNVTLDNITVTGDTIVKGGGEYSIIIKNSSLENLLVIKKDGKIRIVSQGSTSIGKTYLYSSAKLQGERLNKESFGDLEIIRVTPGEKIELEGSFTKIDVKVPSEIQVNGKSKVEEINVHENTEEVSIFVSAYSIIDKIYVYTEIKVDNRGIITEALGDFAKTSIYENRLPLNLQPKTSSSSRPSVDKYTLTLNSNIDNGGSLSGSGSYEADTNITISAIAYDGYEFIEWKEGEDQITTAASFGYTTTTEDKTFTAYFESTSEFEGGSGTESDPYLVANADQLDKVRNYLDAHFKQVANIDLGVSPWSDGEGWEPIGNSGNKFQGSYNGDGYTISNLFIERPESSSGNYQGLFGYVGLEGNIEDLDLIDSYISGYRYTGTLVGSNFGEVLECSSTNIEVINTWEYAGGLVGQNSGSIKNSFTTGIVKTDDFNAGGLVGYNLSDLSQNTTAQVISCYSDTDVTYATLIDSDGGYPYNLGGLVGYNSRGLVENSYASGDVTGYSRVGGLIGENGAEVINCYALGNITGTYDDIGGLIGYASSGHLLTNSYFNSLQPDNGVGTLKTTIEMQDKSTYVDWDFTNVWTINSSDNGGYPALAWQGYENEGDFAGGSGTQADPYQIETAVHLNNVRNYLDAYFIQVADIDLSDYVTEGGIYYDEGKGWEPLGNLSTPFGGSYNGDGYSISNLYINRDINEVGLFGRISEISAIKNISLISLDIYGNSINGGLVGFNLGNIDSTTVSGIVKGDYSDTGLLVGRNKGEINNSSTSGEVRGSLYTLSSSPNVGGLVGNNAGTSSSITNSFSTAEVYGVYEMGGLVGYNEGSIRNSYSKGNVSGSYYHIGGLVGSNTGLIDLCYSESNVSNTSHYSGGLVGQNYGQIRESFSLGSVNSSGAVVGGLVGLNYGLITDCYAHSNVHGNLTVGGLVGSNTYSVSPFLGEIINSYSTGNVSFNNNTNIGGLVGNMKLDAESSYWDTVTSGLITSAGGTGYVTSAMIKSTNSVPIYEGWDFDTIWNIDEGTSYPYLRNNEQIPHPVPIG